MQLNEMLIKGHSLQQQGYLEEAKSIYQHILNFQPQNFDALQLAGSAALITNQYEQALSYLLRAVNIQPNQGLVHYNLGIAFQELNKFESAIVSYDKAISLSPKFASAYSNRGNALLSIKQFDMAIASYDKAITLDPNYFIAYMNRGNALRSKKKYQEAISSYEKAINLNPHYAEVYSNKANLLQELKQFDAAIANYDQAIQLNPNYFEAFSNRGNALRKAKFYEAAMASHNEAIRLNPLYAEAYSNRGNVYLHLKQLDKAFADFEQAISLKPQFTQAHINLGIAFERLEQFDAAIGCWDKAISIDSECADAYFNKSLLKILLGEYEEGWACYEWRWKALEDSSRKFEQPLWLGNESIEDKTILIHAEQGLGDSIQFCRYIAMIEALNPQEIILGVPETLLPLLSTLKNKVTLIDRSESIPEFDLHCPMMSLPHAFKTSVTTIPAETPYLYANEDKAKVWQDKLGNKTNPRVGIVWSGSTAHDNDHNRSLLLKQIAPILALPFEFHCLQKEIRSVDLETLMGLQEHHGLRQHQASLVDFSDTAALLENMDLVITVDTAVAHLAGAMGKKVFVLLAYAPDYRWMLNRHDSPWYPTATLFRQPKLDDWDDVVNQVKLALVKLLQC